MQITFKHDILDEIFTVTSVAPEQENPATVGLPSVYSAFGGRVVLANCSGAISLSVTDNFKSALFEVLTGDARQIVIGLESVTEVSRSALGALVDFASAVLGRGKRLYLLSPPEGLRRTLKELQLTMFFEILPDQDDLLCVLPDE